MLTIDLAIATIGTRINDVRNLLLPQEEGIRYVVSWQGYAGIIPDPDLENRPDVELLRFDGMGLPANRNNALDHCRGDIVVIADDDITYHEDGLKGVRDAFGSCPDMDLGIFKVCFPDRKPYPAGDCRLTLPFPKGYWVTGMEIAVRRRSLGDLRFHPLLELGSDCFGCGEDEFFVISAIRRGMDCRFVDRILCHHPGYSTGTKVSGSILRGQGALIAVMYPVSWIYRLPLKAWRLCRSGKIGFLKGLFHLSEGALKKGMLFRSPRRFRW